MKKKSMDLQIKQTSTSKILFEKLDLCHKNKFLQKPTP
jgi:hypothetical protein